MNGTPTFDVVRSARGSMPEYQVGVQMADDLVGGIGGSTDHKLEFQKGRANGMRR